MMKYWLTVLIQRGSRRVPRRVTFQIKRRENAGYGYILKWLAAGYRNLRQCLFAEPVDIRQQLNGPQSHAVVAHLRKGLGIPAKP